jgi:phosphoglycolate phosphatase-like HAD superfamily hydrolase
MEINQNNLNASSKNLRILLFDIDGTLLSTVNRTLYRARVAQAVTNIFGTAGKLLEISFSGKTDIQIISEALENEGVSLKEVWDNFLKIEQEFTNVIDSLSQEGEVFKRCPNVEELLTKLKFDSNFVVSVLTGNLESLSWKKLSCVGLRDYFSSPGAFGSDHDNRLMLAPIAQKRLSKFLGVENLSPEQFIIIGDTVRDIACARHFGAKVLAVATGVTKIEDLANARPDFLFETLSDTDKVLQTLASL